jgi:hypothetical protein
LQRPTYPAYAQPARSKSVVPLVLAIIFGGVALLVFTCCGLPCIIGAVTPSSMDKADKQWEAGNKADAVALYSEEIEGPFPSAEPRLYTRVIEHHLDAGNADRASHFASLAAEQGIDISAAPENVRAAVTAAKAVAEREKEEERLALAEQAAAADEADRAAADEAARAAEHETDVDGLVLLKDTVEGRQTEFGGEITGTVVNRRNRKLGYVQITFNLYDESGAQVGSALANINGLEPDGRWNFEANSFGKKFSTYKFSELSGF